MWGSIRWHDNPRGGSWYLGHRWSRKRSYPTGGETSRWVPWDVICLVAWLIEAIDIMSRIKGTWLRTSRVHNRWALRIKSVNSSMKFFLATLFVSAVSSIAVDQLIPGAQIISESDTRGLERVGGHHDKYHDRRTITIRPSRNDTDDVSRDFLWGIKHANHGGRLLLKKGEKYVIGRKLDLTFLDDIEVQLDGELKVCVLSCLKPCFITTRLM